MTRGSEILAMHRRRDQVKQEREANMKSIKDARTRAWQHEFDLVDDEREERRLTRDRAHRVALHRAQGAVVPTLPAAASLLPEQLAAMPRMSMTRHAAHRLKNRGISLAQVLVIADFGAA